MGTRLHLHRNGSCSRWRRLRPGSRQRAVIEDLTSNKFVTILCLEAVTFGPIIPSERIEGHLRISVLRSLFLFELIA